MTFQTNYDKVEIELIIQRLSRILNRLEKTEVNKNGSKEFADSYLVRN